MGEIAIKSSPTKNVLPARPVLASPEVTFSPTIMAGGFGYSLVTLDPKEPDSIGSWQLRFDRPANLGEAPFGFLDFIPAENPNVSPFSLTISEGKDSGFANITGVRIAALPAGGSEIGILVGLKVSKIPTNESLMLQPSVMDGASMRLTQVHSLPPVPMVLGESKFKTGEETMSALFERALLIQDTVQSTNQKVKSNVTVMQPFFDVLNTYLGLKENLLGQDKERATQAFQLLQGRLDDAADKLFPRILLSRVAF